MKLCIITHTDHYNTSTGWQAYGPYVREMDLWMKGEVHSIIVAPVSKDRPDAIHQAYANKQIDLRPIPAVSLTGPWEILKNLVLAPYILYQIFRAMQKADHIHLRCPGNIGLAGCFVQMLFPSKKKTAKYAGNWDPGAMQPWSYRLQKWLLSNRLLSRNTKVLVYGQWPDQTANVLPFMTASYHNSDISPLKARSYGSPYKFLFVGSLSIGKRPDYALQLLHGLQKRGVDCSLDFFGEGVMRKELEAYIKQHGLAEYVTLHGNQSAQRVQQAYLDAHFVLLPSKSEGWPKVLAEGMFWGCIPIATPVSCVPWMLADGKRGVLLSLDPKMDMEVLKGIVSDPIALNRMAAAGYEWSTAYTMETFEERIQELLW